MERFPPVYIINLDRSKDRWQQMLKQCEKVGIKPIRISAIDGKKLTKEDYERESTSFCTKFCTPASVAIGMSHIKAWESLIQSDKEYAIVLEDDVEFTDNFREKWPVFFAQVPKDFDFVYIGCGGACVDNGKYDYIHWKLYTYYRRIVTPRRKKIGKISDNVFVPEYPAGYYAYMISKKAAYKLLNETKGKLKGHIDQMFIERLNDLNVYAFSPTLVRTEAKVSSSINIGDHKFPKLFNKITDHFIDSTGVSMAYSLSISFLTIGGVNINTWTFIFLLLIIIALIKRSKKMLTIILAIIAINL